MSPAKTPRSSKPHAVSGARRATTGARSSDAPSPRLEQHPHYEALRAHLLGDDWLEMLSEYGAHAMAIGRKIVAGRRTNVLALRIYVERKTSSLSGVRRVPGRVQVTHPGTGIVYHVPSDVVQSLPARHHGTDPTATHRPVPGGVSGSIGAGRGGVAEKGTLGGWAWDARKGSVVLLSNEHVLGHRPGTHLLQPALGDVIGQGPERVGTVRRGLPRPVGTPVFADCAIGVLDATTQPAFEVPTIGAAIMALDEPRLGQSVEKFGRSTKHTVGVVDAMHWQGVVASPHPGAPAHHYRDAVLIRPRRPSRVWATGGDSGSLIFARDAISDSPFIKPVVGLHFGGDPDRGYGLACRMTVVFEGIGLATLPDGAQRAICADIARASRPRRATAASVERALALLGRALTASAHGRAFMRAVVRHRGEITSALLRDASLRRAAAVALGPLLAGAPPLAGLLARTCRHSTIARIVSLLRRLRSTASPAWRRSLDAMLRTAIFTRTGPLGTILGVRTTQVENSPVPTPASASRGSTTRSRLSAARSASALRGRAAGSAEKARRKKAVTPSGASGT